MEIIKTLKQIPVLRILSPLILGILIGKRFSIDNLIFFVCIAGFLFLTIVLAFLPYFKNKYSSQKYYGISISLFFLFLGILLYNLKNQKLDLINDISSHKKSYLITVKELPHEKNKTFQVKARLDAVVDSQIYITAKQGLILYFAKEDSSIKKLIPGDKIIIRTELDAIKNKCNPDEFDYKTFVNRRGFTHTAYLKKENYELLKENRPRSFETQVASIRISILNRLKTEFDDGTYALLSSMLIGVKDDLDEETRESFSDSGITHLLAISGLHVGILYLVLTYLLSFLGNTKTARLSRNIIILLVLWFYAMLAGLSPSVVRATIMFSVIAVGKLISRKTIIYNSLAFAALLMLIINPNNIFEVGFQLSFLAVLGIVYLQPRISSLVETKITVLSYLWGLVSVSIAAQLATFPLTIYYFHQFPNYFILGNLLAIPLFFVDLILGLVYVLLGWIPIIGPVFQFVTAFLSDLILKSSEFVSDLRFSVTEGLTLSSLQVLLIYISLIFIAYFLSIRRGKYLVTALISLLIVISINVFDLLIKTNEKELTIYNNQSTLISYIDGFHSYCFIDSANNQENGLKYALKEHLINQKAFRLRVTYEFTNQFEHEYLNIQKLPKENKLVVFGKYKLILLKTNSIVHKGKIKVDYIILEDNVKTSIEDLKKNFEFEKVIFASSNQSWNITSWISECKLQGIEYFSIPDMGAFQIKL